MSKTLISLKLPLTAQYPVAPDPTVSVTANNGGLITSYSSPPATTSIDFKDP